jgi:hypothetical protein
VNNENRQAQEDKPDRTRLQAVFKKTLLDLTNVCPLLTKQYIQVGLQIHVIQFLDGHSPHTWYGLRVSVIRPMGSSINK